MPRGIRHGYKGTPEYSVWVAMRMRCRSPQGHDVFYYQGVTFPPEWDDFTVFLRDVGPRPSMDHQLDRRDNTKGYSADNCRWVTRDIQMQNTRKSKWWFVFGEKFESLTGAAAKYKTSAGRVKAWCEGRTDGGYTYPPKPNCWSEKKYDQ